jgi:SMC interacting uncharacterized protein involved in chromosome segregation
MDELMKQAANPIPVHEPAETESDPAAEQASEPKHYTLKSARTALRRMEAEAEKKAEQIAALKKEITEMKPKMRAMSALIEQLEKEETEKKVHDALRMRSKHMTGTQVLAALDLVQQLESDLGDMDITELASMIRATVSEKKKQTGGMNDAE